jgi:hypothetical protein
MARVLVEEWSDSDLRKLLRESPGEYRRLMELAQKTAVPEAPAASSTPSPADREDDPGEEAARALIREFQDYHDRERAREDAELAERPDAAMIGATLQEALKGAVERYECYQRECDRLRAMVRELGGDPGEMTYR